ncbi:MAG TPA: hypothetical protein VFO51_08250 [Sphingomicrobium sp.]|nr:hypothetical protein [Sphingomicrobium sp.]
MTERKDSDGAIHETTTEARAGVTPHVTRYVLTVGLGLVVVIFAFLFFFGSK